MAIGIVPDEVFEKELSVSVIHKDLRVGRGSASETPRVIRKVIAEEALNGTRARILSAEFGVSQSSISAYKHDATSTASYNEPDKDLKESNDKVKDDIVSVARSKLMKALEYITDDKLSAEKPRDLAAIAKDMSAVVGNTSPSRGNNANVQFIFHSPKSRDESEFDIIEVTQ